MKKIIFTLTPLIFSILVTNAYAHTAMYNYGYENGKIDAAVGVNGDTGASALCTKYSSQKHIAAGIQYDRCAQGYSDGYNHSYGIKDSIVATDAYVETPV
jgi:hypothetical protein